MTADTRSKTRADPNANVGGARRRGAVVTSSRNTEKERCSVALAMRTNAENSSGTYRRTRGSRGVGVASRFRNPRPSRKALARSSIKVEIPNVLAPARSLTAVTRLPARMFHACADTDISAATRFLLSERGNRSPSCPAKDQPLMTASMTSPPFSVTTVDIDRGQPVWRAE